ncbi:tyrosine-type recombinase/integrase [Yersinia pseudotuberculosis]|uniref:tyrosine-type recombinase/integrase n=1 Tax=Yersinia pseudotuberculosis TaxID=633 RepID=UPI0005E0ABAF|nr:site-specific integrase [Yersinia pseudotuberculosis]EKN5087667.1 site-specific integrase [Yersinia enterocolitica]CND62521.1 Tyrosine recombinase XerC [Yersinia pseudotuberculosis]
MFRLRRSNGDFPFHVTDPQGLPHLQLTLYACQAGKYHSAATVKVYLRHLLAFFSWADKDEVVKRQQWDLQGDSTQVRATLEHFLTTRLHCTLFFGRNLSGADIRKVQVTWGKAYRINHLLAALRSFYQLLIVMQFYSHPHPLDLHGTEHIIARMRQQHLDDFVKLNQRSPMPSDSGVDRWRPLRLASSYYRIKDNHWIPEYLEDPELMSRVLTAGTSAGWTLQDIAIARILFDSGCRIHEVCSLTLQDWEVSGFRNMFSALSKGSRGKRVKTIIMTDKTLKILLRYIRQDRPELLPYLNGSNVLPTHDEHQFHLFCTKRGGRLTPDYFRRYRWTPALTAGGLKIRAHQVRHWFVTMALNEIHISSGSEADLRQKRSALQTLMGWRSDMLPAYDQARQRYDLPSLASAIHAYIERKQLESPPVSDEPDQRESYGELMLREMFGDLP